MALVLQEDFTGVELRIIGLTKRIDLTAREFKTPPKKTDKEPAGKLRQPLNMEKIIRVIKSFRIKRLYVNLGFEDMQTNGVLFPLFYWLTFITLRKISVNFCNRNEINIELENNLYRILRAYFKSTNK